VGMEGIKMVVGKLFLRVVVIRVVNSSPLESESGDLLVSTTTESSIVAFVFCVFWMADDS
jgi:hypothetical protein